MVSTSEAMIAGLKLEQYGHSPERASRLIGQLELQPEKPVTDAAEDAVRVAL